MSHTPEITRAEYAELLGKYQSLLAERDALREACEAAVRCLKSIELNERIIVDTLRKADGGISGATVSTIGGWKRNLEHSRAALALGESKT